MAGSEARDQMHGRKKEGSQGGDRHEKKSASRRSKRSPSRKRTPSRRRSQRSPRRRESKRHKPSSSSSSSSRGRSRKPQALFDFVPPKVSPQSAAKANWFNWLKPHGIEDGIYPINDMVEALVAHEFWSPSTVVWITKEAFTNHMALDSVVRSHTSMPQIVSRLWELCMACSSVPRSVSDSPSGGGFTPEALKQLVTTIHTRGAPKNPYAGILNTPLVESEDPPFDLPRALADANLSSLPVHWFSEVRILTGLRKLFERAAKDRSIPLPLKPGSPAVFVAETGPEHWIPAWVGRDLAPGAQSALIKKWKSSIGTDGAITLACVQCLWLSHASVGLVSFNSVFIFMSVALRMQADRGVQFFTSYFRKLLHHIQLEIKGGTTATLDSFLVAPVEKIILSLELDQRPSGAQPIVATPKVKAGKQRSRSRSKTRPVKPGANGSDSKPLKQDGGRPTPKKTARPKVCFQHDPRNSKVCPNGTKCSNEHLDTSQADQAQRFDRAFAAFKGKKGGE